MSGSGWSCPHEVNGLCGKVNERPCDPGMKGCELYGRYAFFDGSKNERLKQKQARSPACVPGGPAEEALAQDRMPGMTAPAAPNKE